MLRTCSRAEFEAYSNFAYELAMDPTRSAYPTYRDGIKTMETFLRRSRKAFERDAEEMLLFEDDGEVQGLIHYYWLPEDRSEARRTGFPIEKARQNRGFCGFASLFLAYAGFTWTMMCFTSGKLCSIRSWTRWAMSWASSSVRLPSAAISRST